MVGYWICKGNMEAENVVPWAWLNYTMTKLGPVDTPVSCSAWFKHHKIITAKRSPEAKSNLSSVPPCKPAKTHTHTAESLRRTDILPSNLLLKWMLPCQACSNLKQFHCWKMQRNIPSHGSNATPTNLLTFLLQWLDIQLCDLQSTTIIMIIVITMIIMCLWMTHGL